MKPSTPLAAKGLMPLNSQIPDDRYDDVSGSSLDLFSHDHNHYPVKRGAVVYGFSNLLDLAAKGLMLLLNSQISDDRYADLSGSSLDLFSHDPNHYPVKRGAVVYGFFNLR